MKLQLNTVELWSLFKKTTECMILKKYLVSCLNTIFPTTVLQPEFSLFIQFEISNLYPRKTFLGVDLRSNPTPHFFSFKSTYQMDRYCAFSILTIDTISLLRQIRISWFWISLFYPYIYISGMLGYC